MSTKNSLGESMYKGKWSLTDSDKVYLKINNPVFTLVNLESGDSSMQIELPNDLIEKIFYLYNAQGFGFQHATKDAPEFETKD
jgi:hypothetical protein